MNKTKVDTSSCLKACSGLIISTFSKTEKNQHWKNLKSIFKNYDNYKKITSYPSGYHGNCIFNDYFSTKSLCSIVLFFFNPFRFLVESCKEYHGQFLCGGNDAATSSNEDNKEACARRCYDVPNCVAWTFKNGHYCLVKTSNCTGDGEDWMWGTRECGFYEKGMQAKRLLL